MLPPGRRMGSAAELFRLGLKCAVRGWLDRLNFRQRYSRLKLVVNNSRFLILPTGMFFNLVVAVCRSGQRRLASDWQVTFGHGVLLLETFVDPQRFRGRCIGRRTGYVRTRRDSAAPPGYSARPQSLRWSSPTLAGRRRRLAVAAVLPPLIKSEVPKSCSAPRRCNPPRFFRDLPDPRRAQGRRHRLSTVLGIAAGAVCVACAATEQSPTGRKVWGRRRASASAVVAKKVVTLCRASRSSATC